MHSPVRDTVRLSLVESPNEEQSHRCYDCNVNFTSEYYLLGHLLHHIKQPTVLVRKLQQAPIKITFKSKSDNNFEIINSPINGTSYMFTSEYLAEESQISTGTDNSEVNTIDSGTFSSGNLEEHNEMLDEMFEQSELESKISFSTDFEMIGNNKETSNGNQEQDKNSSAVITELSDGNDQIEQIDRDTPPSQSSSPTDYPKIRIKTTGLLKERLTITEITEDNPSGEYRGPDMVELASHNENNTNNSSNFWSSCLEDPLKLPESDRDDSTLLSSFLNNNNDQAKAFGITTDSEFISLDRLDDRNRNALQVYNPTSAMSRDNSLDNLTGLPMQQLAEQVSRLQPSGNSGMHQQNVLINIQQFPQAPQQPAQHYQHPPMFQPHPPHPGMPTQPPPLYQPYQYQPGPMYYPPTPNYPTNHPHMPPPPPPQLQQANQQMPPQPQHPPHPQQQSMPPPQPPQYRQPMPPRPPAPRQCNPQHQRLPVPRAPMVPRQRAPMMRPRGGGMGTAIRGPRPRMINQTQMNGNLPNQHPNQLRVIKRSPEQIQSLQAKKKRMDVLVPDKNDDADCQVIAVQPKNTDGGLPQIQSVQGGTTDPTDNVMHLSDSITLSVRNPPPKPPSPKKSDAKDVANILATRGITVTASPKQTKQSSKDNQPPSVAINLNSAVSIIPTAKQQSTSPSPKSPGNDSRLPTVDLTDDSVQETPRSVSSKPTSAQPPPNPPQKNGRCAALPFKCDLCPAQYPTLGGLSKHRQTYHKTGSLCEIGIPLVDLKQPGVVQKLSGLGITHFVPMPSSTPDGHFALPVVTLNAARNSSICNLTALGASSILSLGPVRSLPKSQVNQTPQPKQ